MASADDEYSGNVAAKDNPMEEDDSNQQLSLYETAGWSELPNDILELLLKQSSLVGFLRFGAVCKAWKSVSRDTPYRPPQVPWLMLYNGNPQTLSFFSPWEGKVYKIRHLPEIIGEKRCWASWRSWLIMIDYFSYHISLLNPLSRVEIQLLQLPKDQYYQQIALSSSTPSHPLNNTINGWAAVMVTCSDQNVVRFCKPGDRTWTEIGSVGLGYYHDLVSYKGKFYLVDAYGAVFVCDVDACPPQVTEIPEIPLIPNVSRVKYYLLESCGELFFILRLFRYPHKTNEFRVFKLDAVSGSEWIQVESLGDRSFFLATDGTDKDNSGSIDISTNYDGWGSRKNCIYFVEEDDDISSGRRERLGKFSLDGRIITYSVPDDDSIWLSGLWVKPNPWQTVPCQ